MNHSCIYPLFHEHTVYVSTLVYRNTRMDNNHIMLLEFEVFDILSIKATEITYIESLLFKFRLCEYTCIVDFLISQSNCSVWFILFCICWSCIWFECIEQLVHILIYTLKTCKWKITIEVKIRIVIEYSFFLMKCYTQFRDRLFKRNSR